MRMTPSRGVAESVNDMKKQHRACQPLKPLFQISKWTENRSLHVGCNIDLYVTFKCASVSDVNTMDHYEYMCNSLTTVDAWYFIINTRLYLLRYMLSK